LEIQRNQAPCAYFRPALLAQSNADELKRTFEEIDVQWPIFAFQAATNFGSEWDEPRLGLKQHVLLDGTKKTDERYTFLASSRV
jgi:hypothetical protein